MGVPLYSGTGPRLGRDPHLVSCSAVTTLKFLTVFDKGPVVCFCTEPQTLWLLLLKECGQAAQGQRRGLESQQDRRRLLSVSLSPPTRLPPALFSLWVRQG